MTKLILSLSLTSDTALDTLEEAIARRPLSLDDLLGRLNNTLTQFGIEEQFKISPYQAVTRLECPEIPYPLYYTEEDEKNIPAAIPPALSYIIEIDNSSKTIRLDFQPTEIEIPSTLTREEFVEIKERWAEIKKLNLEIDIILRDYAQGPGFDYDTPFSYFKVPENQPSLFEPVEGKTTEPD